MENIENLWQEILQILSYKWYYIYHTCTRFSKFTSTLHVKLDYIWINVA